MLSRVYCILFVLFLFMPTLQFSLNILPNTTLIGKELDFPEDQWSWAGWLDGSFQDQYTKRRDIRLGLRDYFVKTYNQLQYTLFNRITSTTGTNVVIGKDNWLYEKVYIDKFNTASRDDGSLIDARVQRLRKLQDQLEGMGIVFVYVIAPSKAELYPEYIPDNLRKEPLAPGIKTDYQQTVASFEKYGVYFVDSHTLLWNEKQENGHQLFGPSGVHWNKYAAYLAWKNLASVVNDKLRVPLQLPPLDHVESRTSEPVEADLGGVLNLWERSLTSPETDYPVFALPPTTNSEKPSILLVGDSFLFTLVDIIQRAKLATDVDAWYYFKRHFKYLLSEGHLKDSPMGSSVPSVETPMDKSTLDWQNQLFGKDMVILVASESGLPALGFDFIEEASAAIERLAGGKKL